MTEGAFTEQPGLFYGKTGIAVFFFHYARLTGNASFADYAMGLIEKAQKQITDKTSIRYDIGIAGIGTAVEYLLQNDFLEAKESDLFEEFDERMYQAAMHDPYSGFGLEGSLTGWGRYFIYRLRGAGYDDSKLHEALKHIAKIISKKIKLNKIAEKERPDVYRFFLDLTSIPEYADLYAHSLKSSLPPAPSNRGGGNKVFNEAIGQEWQNRKEPDNNVLTNMGLLNGWAAEGMLYLTRFYNLDDAWMKLLL